MWGGSLEQFITNLLAPNRSIRVFLDHSLRRATIWDLNLATLQCQLTASGAVSSVDSVLAGKRVKR